MKTFRKVFSVSSITFVLALVFMLSAYAAGLKITAQPKTCYTAYEKTATVTVKATGDGLKYTWYVKNAGATKFQKSSVTKASYSVKMTDSTKNRQLYCVVSDKNGSSVKSATATLRMKATVTVQPKTSYTAYGKTATVTVKAKGDGLKYAWYVKNAGATKFQKSSVTKASYSVKMTDSTKNRQLYCVVSDKYGNTVKSATATLRMKVTVTTQPKTAYARQGANATATVKAKGDGLKYTWYVKNAGTSKYSKSTITKASYSVAMSDKTHNRSVYCVVTDKYGNKATTSSVYLRRSATVTVQPKSVSVAEGKTAKVTVKAVGDGLKYTWYVKNAGAGKYTVSSITTSAYSVKMTDKVNGRSLYCVVTDKYGKTDKSKTVSLKLKDTPLTITMQPKSTIASPGDTVGFGIVVTGGKAPYTYQLKYRYGDFNGNFKGAEMLKTGAMVEFVFTAKKEYFEKRYEFYFLVADSEGNEVYSDVARIELPLSITEQPKNDIASVGGYVLFKMEICGGLAPYTYQLKYTYGDKGWMDFKDADIFKTENIVEITLTAKEEYFEKQYKFRIVVTDVEGNQATSDTVCIEKHIPPLEFFIQPKNIVACDGNDVSFDFSVSGGKAPYTYQLKYTYGDKTWMNFDDAEILKSGALTKFMFATKREYFEKQYKFCIVATDAEGRQVTSDTVWIDKFFDSLSIVQQPQVVTASSGDKVTFTVIASGGIEPLEYNWTYSCDEFDFTSISGNWATGYTTPSVSFTITDSEFTRGYRYCCVITDAVGNQVVSDEVYVVKA